MSRLVALATFAAVLAIAIVWVWNGGFSSQDGPRPPADAPGAATAPVPGGGLAFPPFALDEDALGLVWERERDTIGQLDDASTALLDAWHRNNFALGLSARGLFDGDAAALQTALAEQRRQWSHMRTVEDYRVLGWTAYDRFAAGLDDLLTLARTTQTPVRALLDDPLQPVVHAHYEACGDFVPGALEAGLIGEYGALLVDPGVVVLMFRYRWMWDASAIYPFDTALPGIEHREVLRWRIEDAGLDLDDRLAAIDRFEREFSASGFSPAFARAVAYSDVGMLDRATEELGRARGASAGASEGSGPGD